MMKSAGYKLGILREILKDQIEWYEKHLNDPDFIYDEAYLQFEGLSRGAFDPILSLLHDKQDL